MEAAKAMGVSRATINTWQHEGLPCERKGREVLFKPWVIFAWRVGREIVKSNGLDTNDTLSLAILGRCRDKSPAAMRQEAIWLAEDIGRERDEALVVLGEMMGRSLL